MNHHFAGAGHEVIVSCPVDDQSLVGEISSLDCIREQDNKIIRPPFLETEKHGVPLLQLNMLILEFFFGEIVRALILRGILSWLLEAMCHWSLRILIT